MLGDCAATIDRSGMRVSVGVPAASVTLTIAIRSPFEISVRICCCVGAVMRPTGSDVVPLSSACRARALIRHSVSPSFSLLPSSSASTR